MSITQLYCQSGCGACATLHRSLVAEGVEVETHDISSDPHAYDTVTSLGYRSLPVLVTPEGTSAAGADAGALARRLTSKAQASAGANRDTAHGPTSPATPATPALPGQLDEPYHPHHLASEPSRPEVVSRKERS
ncbi:MAG: hypothetical protein M0032_02665 [Actinomycetota bacterium]|nr:hypothetical protein [Actinomycetota bacterium]